MNVAVQVNMQPQQPSHILKQRTGPDDPVLQETLEEALSQVTADDVISIADELSARHERLFLNLQVDSASLTSSFADIAAAVTHTKANARALTDYFNHGDHKLITELLITEMPAPVRVAIFVEKLNALDTRLAMELATGLLHYTSPKDNWLWTRWLWDPTTATGILPLLAGSTHNLLAENFADGYARVGSVTAMSMKFAEGTGLWSDELVSNEKRAPFANSAFLACAYNVYLFGTTSWRLSREFNNLLPSLPNMARKLLGLKKSGA
ncbi:MAG: hypothetical protein HY863_12085 [Chloroflexi bacterium]|nr:hypothetical protein [Chloroflexota bacterium]